MATMSNSITAKKPDKTRFISLDDVKLAQIMSERESVNTKKATKTSVKIFRTYLTEKNLDPNFESYNANRLDSALYRFFAEVRNAKGELYQKSSMVSLRHGLNRHLQNVNIINSSEFKNSSQMFTAMLKELKRQGKGKGAQFEPIVENDLVKLYQYFNLYDANKLQEKVFVDVVLYFGCKGRETLRELRISEFETRTDESGLQYICMPKTSTNPVGERTAENRMYELNDKTVCPVKSFGYHACLLHPDCPYLLQCAKSQPLADLWYNNMRLGLKTVGHMMHTISKKAKLSRLYSNYCLRSTSAKFLCNGRLIPIINNSVKTNIVDNLQLVSESPNSAVRSTQHSIGTQCTRSNTSLTKLGRTSNNTRTWTVQPAKTIPSNVPVTITNKSLIPHPPLPIPESFSILEELHSDKGTDYILINNQFADTNLDVPTKFIDVTDVINSNKILK